MNLLIVEFENLHLLNFCTDVVRFLYSKMLNFCTDEILDFRFDESRIMHNRDAIDQVSNRLMVLACVNR